MNKDVNKLLRDKIGQVYFSEIQPHHRNKLLIAELPYYQIPKYPLIIILEIIAKAGQQVLSKIADVIKLFLDLLILGLPLPIEWSNGQQLNDILHVH